jgi:hypothetical protein
MIILSVGNNSILLQQITAQLNQHGFKANWTTFSEKVVTLYNGSDLDMVAFGREINQKTKLFIMSIFSVQNPAIIFVDGLAPIPSLIVDQIRHTAAIAKGRNGNPLKGIEINKADRSVAFTATAECKVKIDLYQLSPFYAITEKVIAQTTLAPGKHTFTVDKKDKSFFGKHFIVVKANDKPWHVGLLA